MKIKKLFLVASTLPTLTIPIVTTISCSGENARPGVWLAIDGSTHDENDKSFNQQAFEGIQDYLDDLTDEERADAYNQKEAYSRRPAGDKDVDFKQLYAQIPKGSTIIANGYNHSGALKTAKEEIVDKKIIYLDGNLDFDGDGEDDAGYDNIAAIQYKIQEAAYLGGYALAEYASTKDGFDSLKAQNQSDNDDQNLVEVGVYGGTPIPPVVAFLGGFEFGFKDAIHDLKNSKKDDEQFPYVENLEFIELENKGSHFSGDYTSGQGRIPTESLRNKGADVIMAVAGPQTRDTLDHFKGKVIGPDTDQAVLYEDDADRFLFSVMKDLRLSTENMLKKINGDASISDQYKGFGKTTIGNLDNGLVKISDTTKEITSYFEAAKKEEDLMRRASAVKDMWFLDDYQKFGHDWINHLDELPNE